MEKQDIIEGVLLVDKQAGSSSHDIVNKIRRTLRQKRVGHAGTLDPFATGLLVVLLGRYTKASPFLTEHDKWYEARVDFSHSTTTDDTEGEQLEISPKHDLSAAAVESALANMLGEQEQVPPIYSAISVNGVRAYNLARRGEEVNLSSRKVCFYRLELVDFSFPYADIRVRCSKGTYIRAFARDLGKQLGMHAHLSALRRIVSGQFTLQHALSESSLAEPDAIRTHLLQGPTALAGVPVILLNEIEAMHIRQGKQVIWRNEEQIVPEKPYLAVCDNNLIAFVQLLGDRLVSIRGF